MIIHKTTNQIQTMSTHPDDNWMGEEWALVPKSLHEKAWQLAPYCELVFNGDTLTDIVDDGTRPPEPEVLPNADELLNLMLGVIDDE